MVSSLCRFHAASGDEKDAEKSTESNVYLGVSPLLYAYFLYRFLPNVSGIRPACFIRSKGGLLYGPRTNPSSTVPAHRHKVRDPCGSRLLLCCGF